MAIQVNSVAGSSAKQRAITNKIQQHAASKARSEQVVSIKSIIQKNINLAGMDAQTETYATLAMAISERIKTLGENNVKTKDEILDVFEDFIKIMPPSSDLDSAYTLIHDLLSQNKSTQEIAAKLLEVYKDPVIVALVIQSFLAKKKTDKNNKNLLTGVVDDLLGNADIDSMSMVFATFEFGLKNSAVRQKINKIYQESASSFEGIVGLYQKLKQQFSEYDDRIKSINTLMHSFAHELNESSNALFEIKVGFILKELKRLHSILTMDSFSEETIKFINKITSSLEIKSDDVMDTLVEWLDTEWIYPELLTDNCENLGFKDTKIKILYLQNMLSIIKKLPSVCYSDIESRKHIINVINQYIELTAKDERRLNYLPV